MSTLSRSIRLLIPALLFAGLFVFPSCEEEGGDMEAVVIVRYLGDTATLVPGATVYLQKGTAISVEGVTDENGRYSHVFELEAIIDVYADKDTGNVNLTGSSVIRLKPNKTVYRTVYLSE